MEAGSLIKGDGARAAQGAVGATCTSCPSCPSPSEKGESGQWRFHIGLSPDKRLVSYVIGRRGRPQPVLERATHPCGGACLTSAQAASELAFWRHTCLASGTDQRLECLHTTQTPGF